MTERDGDVSEGNGDEMRCGCEVVSGENRTARTARTASGLGAGLASGQNARTSPVGRSFSMATTFQRSFLLNSIQEHSTEPNIPSFVICSHIRPRKMDSATEEASAEMRPPGR